MLVCLHEHGMGRAARCVEGSRGLGVQRRIISSEPFLARGKCSAQSEGCLMLGAFRCQAMWPPCSRVGGGIESEG